MYNLLIYKHLDSNYHIENVGIEVSSKFFFKNVKTI